MPWGVISPSQFPEERTTEAHLSSEGRSSGGRNPLLADALRKPVDIESDVSGTLVVFDVDRTVEGVYVVNDIADIFGEGVPVARLEYPQAIALRTDSGVIMLDKEVWFSELPVIKHGDSIDDILYDESANWEDDPEEDPTTHFEFHTETLEL